MRVGTVVLSGALFLAPPTPVDVTTLPDPAPAATRFLRRTSGLRREPSRTGTPRVVLPARSFVVVGGVPGAGKSTLLHRIRVTSPRGTFSVRDPEDIRTRWERLLGGRRWYRVWRPAVYLEHYLRLLWALPGRRIIVLHDTATRRWMRRLLAVLARLAGRRAVLLWIDVTLSESLDGQAARGRAVPERTIRKHWRRWSRLDPAGARTGYAEVHRLSRTAARTVVLERSRR